MTSINRSDLSVPLLRPSRQPSDSCLKRSFKCISKLSQRFGQLGSNLAMLILNTLHVSGVVFKAVSDNVTNMSLILMDVSGFLTTHYTMHYLDTCISNIRFGIASQTPVVTIVATLKVIELANSYILLCTSFVADLYGIDENYDSQSKIYEDTQNWSYIITALGCLNTIIFMVINRRVLKNFEDTMTNSKIQSIFRAFDQDINILRENPERHFAAYFSLCMDKDTREQMLYDVQLIESRGEFARLRNVTTQIENNIKTLQNIDDPSRTVLNFVGYGLMIYMKYYKITSVEGALSAFAISAAYSGVSIIDTYREVKQRNRLNEAVVEEILDEEADEWVTEYGTREIYT